jgi:hypothetical protein
VVHIECHLDHDIRAVASPLNADKSHRFDSNERPPVTLTRARIWGGGASAQTPRRTNHRRQRAHRSTTYSLRVRVGGVDAHVPLGNTVDGWDEARVERAREQLLAKIKLGLWTPPSAPVRGDSADEEPTFRELTSDWYYDRERNPAIRASTVKDDH